MHHTQEWRPSCKRDQWHTPGWRAGDAQGRAEASAAADAAEAALADLEAVVQQISELLAELAGWRQFFLLDRRMAEWGEQFEGQRGALQVWVARHLEQVHADAVRVYLFVFLHVLVRKSACMHARVPVHICWTCFSLEIDRW